MCSFALAFNHTEGLPSYEELPSISLSHVTSIPVPCEYDETVASPMFVYEVPDEVPTSVALVKVCGIAIPRDYEGINAGRFDDGQFGGY